MEYGQCAKCKQYKMNPHNCGCQLFYCWWDDTKDDPEEMHKIYASEPEEAAERIAQDWCSHDGEPHTTEVYVLNPGDAGDAYRIHFVVEPEIQVIFRAQRVEEIFSQQD